MTGRDNRIENLLAATSLRIHPQRFVIANLPLSLLSNLKQRLGDIEAPFWSLSIEESEITLILPNNVWTIMVPFLSKAKVEEDYRVITLDISVNWEVAGYLTKIISLLTNENITSGVVSGATRNSLIIKNKDLIKSIEILNRAIETSQ